MRIEHKLTIPLIIIVICNAISAYSRESNFIGYMLYVGLFLILIILLLIKRIKINIKKIKIDINLKVTKNFISITTLILSLLCLALGNPSSLNDFFFFSYALWTAKISKKLYWIYGILYFMVLVGRFYVLRSSDIIIHLAGGLFILAIYQHFMHPKKIIKEDITPNYLISPVKKEVVDIIRLIILGYEYHEINDKLELNVTPDRVRRKVKEEMELKGFRNREHMIFFLTEKGVIKPISYKLDTKNKSNDTL